MRTVKIVILRFYLDQDNGAQFCGDLQTLPGRRTAYFKSEAELLSQMRQLAAPDSRPPSINSPEPGAPGTSGQIPPFEITGN